MKTKLESNREEISRKVDKYWVPMIVHLDGGGDKATSQAAAAGAFKPRPRKKVLVVGINDESAIGAVEAGKETANGTEIAIVGHGGSMEIMDIG
jgi:ribose transport system substrate-binding protein